MENENKKMNFFERTKIAVTKLENYNVFLEEKISIAIKYFFKLLLILSIILSCAQTYNFVKIANRGIDYIKNELPDFSYSDSNLIFSEDVNAYDEKLNFSLISITSEDISNDQVKEYLNDINQGIILLKDRLVYKNSINEITYVYSDIEREYSIDSLNKEKLIEKINSIGISELTGAIFVVFFISLYIINVVSIFIDWIIISIFAYLISKICRVSITFKQAFNISIYALTLSIILSVVYNIAYQLFGFYIEYFRTVYLLISYVYVVAAILLIKSDLVKQKIEVEKVVKIQKEVHDELENPEEKAKDKKEEDKKSEEKNENEDKEENLNGEPDGSEI